MRRALAVAAAILVVALASLGPARACESCYGTATVSPLLDGAKVGVLLLLAVTLSVQGGFVAFFIQLRRRARRFHDAELDTEWNDLQRRDRKP